MATQTLQAGKEKKCASMEMTGKQGRAIRRGRLDAGMNAAAGSRRGLHRYFHKVVAAGEQGEEPA